MSSPASLTALGRLLLTRRRIFVSYHHGGDREYYEAFSRLAADAYDAVEDNSVERLIDSDDAEYVIRAMPLLRH